MESGLLNYFPLSILPLISTACSLSVWLLMKGILNHVRPDPFEGRRGSLQTSLTRLSCERCLQRSSPSLKPDRHPRSQRQVATRLCSRAMGGDDDRPHDRANRKEEDDRVDPGGNIRCAIVHYGRCEGHEAGQGAQPVEDGYSDQCGYGQIQADRPGGRPPEPDPRHPSSEFLHPSKSPPERTDHQYQGGKDDRVDYPVEDVKGLAD